MASSHDHVTDTEIIFPICQVGAGILSGQHLFIGDAPSLIRSVQGVAGFQPTEQSRVFALQPEVRGGRAHVILGAEQAITQSFVIHLVNEVRADRVNGGVGGAVLRRGILSQTIGTAIILIQPVDDLRTVLQLRFLQEVSPGSCHQSIFQFSSGIHGVFSLFLGQSVGNCCLDGHVSVIDLDGMADRQAVGIFCSLRRHDSSSQRADHRQAQHQADEALAILAIGHQQRNTANRQDRQHDPQNQLRTVASLAGSINRQDQRIGIGAATVQFGTGSGAAGFNDHAGGHSDFRIDRCFFPRVVCNVQGNRNQIIAGIGFLVGGKDCSQSILCACAGRCCVNAHTKGDDQHDCQHSRNEPEVLCFHIQSS